jgi:hypothetical protein
MWHLTPDMWHVKCDTWWGVNILSKLQLPTSEWLNQSINHKGVYRTAPATRGLFFTEESMAWYQRFL